MATYSSQIDQSKQSLVTQSKRVSTQRLAREQLIQMLSVIVSILDRIVLAALFYRLWGAQYFEVWSVALAVAGFISFSQFGFASYYQNTIAKALLQGQQNKAKKLFKESFTILSITTVMGIFILALYTMHYFDTSFVDAEINAQKLITVTVILFLSASFKIPLSSIEALYRANREYAIYASILLLGDLFRIILISSAIMLFDQNMLIPAVAVFFAVISIQVIYLLYDKSQRYSGFQYRFSLPSFENLAEAISLSSGFFINTLTTVLLTSLPILMLNDLIEEAGIISAFIIARILFGLPRTISQATSVVIGHESARHIIAADYKSAWWTIKESSQLVAVLSGILVGGLFCFGREFVALWVGDVSMFKVELALVAALPALIMPAANIANNVLMTANKAYQAACARVAQLTLFIGIYYALPDMDPSFAILLALAMSEILGYAIIAKYFCNILLDGVGFQFFYQDTLLAVFSAGLIVGINWIALAVMSPDDILALCLRITCLAISGGMLFWSLGLNKDQRAALAQKFQI